MPTTSATARRRAPSRKSTWTPRWCSRACWPTRALSESALARRQLDEARKDAARIEDVPGQRPSGAAVALVVGLDLIDGRRRFLDGVDGEEANACRQLVFEAGRLAHRRTAAGQVADGAIAQPAGAQLSVDRLAAAQLGQRRADEGR